MSKRATTEDAGDTEVEAVYVSSSVSSVSAVVEIFA